MQTCTNEQGLTIINFGMGSANAATIMDLLSAVQPKGVLFLGKCGGVKHSTEIGHFILPTAAILDCMFCDNPEVLKQPNKRRNYLVGLSVALNKMVSKQILVKASFAGVRGHFYGLPQWTVNGMAETIKTKYHERLLKRLDDIAA